MEIGYIYTITNHKGEVYIGSTTRKLSVRMAEHKYKSKNGCNGLLYDSIREYGFESHKLEVILECELDSLLVVEHDIIRELNPSLNIVKDYNATANGKIWVNDGSKEFQIHSKDVDKYEGLVIGRFNFKKSKHKKKQLKN